MPLEWQENVLLAPYTTVQLGGPARFFVNVRTVEELREALEVAGDKKLRVHILAGGSNTLFADTGFDGLVVKVDLKGIEWQEEGEAVVVRAAAGELWEPLAQEAVERNVAGFECLAGIPGTVGATPVQNVGAYGQEVAQAIVKVETLDRATLEGVQFTNEDCGFSYRMSRFKGNDADRYVITAVTYRLLKDGPPTLVYQSVIDEAGDAPTLARVREVVLKLRKAKSMVLDSADPHTRSCGSFFMNPILLEDNLAHLPKQTPYFPASEGHVSIPAAWLIEQAGWRKGFRRGGVGISDNHPLALVNSLVNYGGTTTELLALAHEIEKSVEQRFGIMLTREPVLVT
jgi:UDP-N-acetylmuramate dehydrogenase